MKNNQPKIKYFDLYGLREEKYEFLESHSVKNTEWKWLELKRPYFWFVPKDFELEEKYNKFMNLKNKEFKVKMRLVGNSYAVSIPKEIVLFMNTQKEMMNDMVRLCFEEMDKLSLSFERVGGIKR